MLNHAVVKRVSGCVCTAALPNARSVGIVSCCAFLLVACSCSWFDYAVQKMAKRGSDNDLSLIKLYCPEGKLLASVRECAVLVSPADWYGGQLQSGKRLADVFCFTIQIRCVVLFVHLAVVLYCTWMIYLNIMSGFVYVCIFRFASEIWIELLNVVTNMCSKISIVFFFVGIVTIQTEMPKRAALQHVVYH